MAASASATYWGFVFWLKHNPYTSIEEMTEADLDNMVQEYAKVNATQSSFTVTNGVAIDPVTYTNIQFPKKGTTTRYAADGSGVATSTTVALNTAAANQSLYPAAPVVS
jgi:hypothetical protein